MKRFRKIIIYCLSILILLITALYLFVLTFKGEIKQALIKILDKQLLTELIIEDISVSPFAKFPKISVVIRNVQLKESIEDSKENLAEISRIYLTMDLIGVLKRNYHINRLYVERGKINIRINENNDKNYIIWKTSSDTSKKKHNFQFDLEKIHFSDIEFSYIDLFENQIILADISKLYGIGKFSEESFELSAETQALIKKIEIHNIEYLNSNKVKLETKLYINQNKNEYNIKNALLDIDNASFSLTGIIKELTKDEGISIQIDFSGKKIKISDIENSLPDSLISKYYPWERSGLLSLDGKVYGTLNESNIPSINLNFSLIEGSLKDKSKPVGLIGIEIHGTFSNGKEKNLKTSQIKIAKFRAIMNEKQMTASGNLFNFEDPVIDINYTTELNLESLGDFIILPDIYKIKGEARINFRYKGKIEEIQTQLSSGKAALSGNIQIINVNFQLDSNGMEYENLNGQMILTANELKIKDLNGKILESKFNLNGVISNYLKFDSINKLTIKANLKSDFINLYELLMPDSSAPKENEPNQVLLIPSNLYAELFLDCKEIVYRKFKAINLLGKIIIDSNKVFINNISLNATDGRMVLNGEIKQSESNQINIKGNAQLSKINITNLFYQFSNFEQNYITYKNLKGLLNANVKINSYWNQDWSADFNKLNVISDLIIDDAELIHFEPIENLIFFIKMKKMQHITFDHIENTILVENRKIVIPQMTLKNSAFTMSVSGIHTFDNDVDYRFKINLTELFFGKNKQNKNEFEGENDDLGGLNLYVIMTGKANDPKYRLDRKAVKDKFVENLREEGKEIKNLFKLHKTKEIKKEDEFEFIWDNE